MKVLYRPHLTKVCGLSRVTHNLAEGLEAGEGVRKKGQSALVDAAPMWEEAQQQYEDAKERVRIKPTRKYMNEETKPTCGGHSGKLS